MSSRALGKPRVGKLSAPSFRRGSGSPPSAVDCATSGALGELERRSDGCRSSASLRASSSVSGACAHALLAMSSVMKMQAHAKHESPPFPASASYHTMRAAVNLRERRSTRCTSEESGVSSLNTARRPRAHCRSRRSGSRQSRPAYWLGVTCRMRLKWRVKWLWSAKPMVVATVAGDVPCAAGRARARCAPAPGRRGAIAHLLRERMHQAEAAETETGQIVRLTDSLQCSLRYAFARATASLPFLNSIALGASLRVLRQLDHGHGEQRLLLEIVVAVFDRIAQPAEQPEEIRSRRGSAPARSGRCPGARAPGRHPRPAALRQTGP